MIRSMEFWNIVQEPHSMRYTYCSLRESTLVTVTGLLSSLAIAY